MEWIAIIALLGVIVYQGWLIWHILTANERSRRDLMDRIMSRDYATYVNSEIVREAAKKPDQIYAEQQEIGIPI
jgi:hypothetical protein